MVARLAALVVAAALIVAALAYRNRGDDGASDGGGDGLVLACASELAELCDQLGGDVDRVVVEPAGTTYDALQQPQAGEIDLWLVPAAFPTMVDEQRQRAGQSPIMGRAVRVGGARIGAAVWNDRAEALKRGCGSSEITWKCIGEVAGRGTWEASGGPAAWGRVKVGLPDPATEGAGTVALGAATSGYFGSPPSSSTDLDDDGYRRWLAGLAAAVRPGTDLARMLSGGPAVLDLFVGLGPAMSPVVDGSAQRSRVGVIYPAPVAGTDIQIVAVGRGRDVPGDILEALRDRMQKTGWTGREAGLPAPGVLDALRTTWEDAAE